MKFDNVICPISHDKVDGNISRITVFINAVFLAAFVFTMSPLYVILVAADYTIRAFFNPAYSPICFVASRIARLLKIQAKQIDAAPKIFASRLGVICSAGAAILFFVGLPITSLTIAAILMVFALLDSVFNFCVGCIIYHYIVFPFYSKKLGN